MNTARRIAAALTAATLLAGAAACASEDIPQAPGAQVNVTRLDEDSFLKEIQLPDGRTVQCIENCSYGFSCDWDHAK